MTTFHVILAIYFIVVALLCIYAYFHRSPYDDAPATMVIVMILFWFVVFPYGWIMTIKSSFSDRDY
jgi:uncharacterized membrane protein YozB (DUF420 family)